MIPQSTQVGPLRPEHRVRLRLGAGAGLVCPDCPLCPESYPFQVLTPAQEVESLFKKKDFWCECDRNLLLCFPQQLPWRKRRTLGSFPLSLTLALSPAHKRYPTRSKDTQKLASCTPASTERTPEQDLAL